MKKAKELTEKELREFYERAMDKPYFRAYITISNQFNAICDEFDRTKITIDGETDEFKNFMMFSKQLLSMMEDMEKMMMKIDPERAKQVKDEQTAASHAALENFVRNKQ